MKIAERLIAPTPPFFQKVRTIGLLMVVISACVSGTPCDFPEAINEIIREMAITGTVMAGLSQAAVKKEEG
ncbi:hypothetical protein ACQKLP_14685 [Chitinophaga sp. NPDC101104]|uniref:hypothetical protein n=1 Tax=Chitinophaga sp. NPDC101104 TaxID=3390561 RepID=UPI003D042288